MLILAESFEGVPMYLNLDYYTRFTIEEGKVEAWSEDNLTVTLKKTKALKEQLDALVVNQTSKELSKFG